MTVPADGRSPIEVLLVEDDADFREVAARRFARSGFQVQQAADGEQGVARARTGVVLAPGGQVAPPAVRAVLHGLLSALGLGYLAGCDIAR